MTDHASDIRVTRFCRARRKADTEPLFARAPTFARISGGPPGRDDDAPEATQAYAAAVERERFLVRKASAEGDVPTAVSRLFPRSPDERNEPFHAGGVVVIAAAVMVY